MNYNQVCNRPRLAAFVRLTLSQPPSHLKKEAWQTSGACSTRIKKGISSVSAIIISATETRVLTCCQSILTAPTLPDHAWKGRWTPFVLSMMPQMELPTEGYQPRDHVCPLPIGLRSTTDSSSQPRAALGTTKADATAPTSVRQMACTLLTDADHHPRNDQAMEATTDTTRTASGQTHMLKTLHHKPVAPLLHLAISNSGGNQTRIFRTPTRQPPSTHNNTPTRQ